MRNVDLQVTGHKLTITIDLEENFGPSASGKTNIVASTGKAVDIPEHPGIKLGLNVYKY